MQGREASQQAILRQIIELSEHGQGKRLSFSTPVDFSDPWLQRIGSLTLSKPPPVVLLHTLGWSNVLVLRCPVSNLSGSSRISYHEA